MKKIVYIISIILVSLTSCKDFLSLSPEYQINEINYYQSEDDYETAVIGIYNLLQGLHNLTIMYPAELLTDNTEINSYTWGSVVAEFDEAEVTSANSTINSIWTSCFTAIAYSNNILSRIDDIEMSESKQNQFQGEALFLRAYCYFYLVRLYGDVPVVNVAFRSPDEISSFDMSRQPVSAIYTVIKDDLTNAATLLDGIELSKGRASKGAAKTLLGKVYLTLNEYENAAGILKEVIDMNAYSLVDDYGSLFDGTNEESDESIFEIGYHSGDLGEGNSFSSSYTPGLFNMAIFPNNMNGNGYMCPTQDLYDSYEEGDERKTASVIDSVLLTDGTYEYTLCGLKFVDFSTGTSGDGGINYTALRYADVLLMYAEALNESNQTSDALPYLNEVRERAGLDDLTGLSKEEFTLAMEKERRVEFFHEGHRWFDLLRTGRAKTVLNAYFESIGSSYTLDDYELLMPIPDDELEISPELEQNDGY
ncbi:RagB/SusD family nutrient uptake outer membrane protein [Maribellus maritimus]|uniref:RagB/SusD family nutrient uptake outer membrane protein n=1 Tax=Maribellus maritimus TaxID=2870838 RepID=UPI001EEBFBCC|nr:RagB/SusD family nutrient uptake outer membrane protein [Maribellus maritimus]MCG6189756.1 RagB/SusD family nutrient uptake outer membrane protein [Maribellus maritimus]